MAWTRRYSSAGLHLFDRSSGVNVLVDEVRVPAAMHSVAPRFVSIALTNACALRCAYCYAPKNSAELAAERVVSWAVSLDGAGCLGVGFGGGEPTAHPRFSELCHSISELTSMAVTFTTHGHRLTSDFVDTLRGSVNFARLSVDGVGPTYERLRGRPFSSLCYAAGLLRSLCPIGINAVVNTDTIGELDALADFASGVGASELLLLPQQPSRTQPGISVNDSQRLARWVREATPAIRLAVSRSAIEADIPFEDVVPGEHPLDAHLHVDASGVLRPDAYSPVGIPVGASILDSIRALRETL